MREAALTMLGILSKAPPFSYMNIPRHRERIEKVFTADNALKYVEFAIKALTQQMELEEALEYLSLIHIYLMKLQILFRASFFKAACSISFS